MTLRICYCFPEPAGTSITRNAREESLSLEPLITAIQLPAGRFFPIISSMRKNQAKGQNRGKRPQARDSRKKKRRDDGRLSGFTTLSQVVGAPKRHAYHSHLPVQDAKIVKEPFETCPLCGSRIESIASCLTTPDGAHAHFDCVIAQIKKDNPLSEGQTLSYSGRGNFAIFEKDGEGKWTVVRRISYESGENFEKMKTFVEGVKV